MGQVLSSYAVFVDVVPLGSSNFLSFCNLDHFAPRFFRRVRKILCDRHYDILMVDADAGKSFGALTTKYLERLREERGTMIAVCAGHTVRWQPLHTLHTKSSNLPWIKKLCHSLTVASGRDLSPTAAMWTKAWIWQREISTGLHVQGFQSNSGVFGVPRQIRPAPTGERHRNRHCQRAAKVQI